MKDQVLGRGLGALIPSRKTKVNLPGANGMPDGQGIVRMVATNKIKVNSYQPRSRFDHDSMEELVKSIKEHGIIQPVVIQETGGEYQLIAGERRVRAAKIAGLKKIPAVFRRVNDQEKLELALVENLQRQNLNPMEKARGLKRLLDEFNLTQDKVAKKIGQSRTSVSNALRLLLLPEKIQSALEGGEITEGHAKVLLGIKSPSQQEKLFTQIIKGKVSVRAAETGARNVKSGGRKKRRQFDPNMADKESQLQEFLGTRVQIRKQGQAGSIQIDFYSSEELNEIIRRILK